MSFNNVIPNNIIDKGEYISDKTWECFILMEELKSELNNIDEDIYNENYDIFKELKNDFENFSNKLSDISEKLQNIKRI